MTSAEWLSRFLPQDPVLLWAVMLGFVWFVAPVVVVISRRDPPVWVTLLVGLAFAVSGAWLFESTPYVDARLNAIVVLLALWAIGAGQLQAAVASVTRGPRDDDPAHPPRPRGLTSALGLFGLLVAGILGASLAYSVRMGELHPWRPPVVWLGLTPLVALAVRSGARAARVRHTAAALTVAGGMVLLMTSPTEFTSGWYWQIPIASGIVGFGLVAASGTAAGWRALARAVGAAGAVLLANRVVFEVAMMPLWWSARDTAADDVPVASPWLPRRSSLARLPMDQARWPIQTLAPTQVVPPPLSMGDRTLWLGKTPWGAVRVAVLAPTDGFRQTIGLRHATTPDRYRLPGIDHDLSMPEVLRELEASSCKFISVGLQNAEDWTAQEGFDVCATYLCVTTSHESYCWDREHP